MSTSILIPKDIETVRHLNKKGFKCELYAYLKTSQIKLLRRLRKNVSLIQKIFMVSPISESNKPPSGTSSSFEILWNKKIIRTSRWAKDKGIT